MNPGTTLSAVRTQQSTRSSRPTKKGRISAALLVELPGIEPDALPRLLAVALPVCSRSVRFSTARYLRFRFRVLTASRLTIYCPGSQDWEDWSGS
jgi:hypothetical protein